MSTQFAGNLSAKTVEVLGGETDHFPSMGSGGAILALTATMLSTYVLGAAVNNLYFHPLAGFSGPVLARSGLTWRFWHSMRGRFHRVIEQQHQRYGPVFRVSPNELSFASAASWKDIYGQKKPGQVQLPKSDFYDIYGSGFTTACVGSERDPTVHARKKKNLTAAFSTRALGEQEGLVQGVINRFVVKIGGAGLGGREGGVDMTEWYEMVAFDVLGEMAFGEGFGCVENEEPHFWIELILKHLLAITLVDNLRRWPLMATIGRYLLPKATVSVRDKHSNFSRRQVERRLDSQSPRKDFLTHITGCVKSGEVSKEEMTAHSSTLIIAGGETTATFLAAVTFYLLSSPESYRKLQAEVRENYTSMEEVTAGSALQLPFLQAVIHEGLRMYPPGSQGFPRISPGAVIDGYWVPSGTEVYTSAWTVTHDAQYFHEPATFKPERWIDANCKDVKEASQPFSLGIRGCLGRNFAFVEMSLTLAKLFFKYDLELVDKHLDWEGQSHMHVMWWKPKLMVSFRQRR